MGLLEYIKYFFCRFGRNKLRAFLTMLGVVVGVAAMVAVSSVGTAGQMRIYDELSQFGMDRIMIYSDEDSKPLTIENVNRLKDEIDGIDAIVPCRYWKGNVNAEKSSAEAYANVVGTNSDYGMLEKIEVDAGRFLKESDQEYGKKQAVIGSILAEELFGNSSPIGKKLVIHGVSFKIIGVYKNTAPLYNSIVENRVYIPLTAFAAVFGGDDMVSEISVTAKDRDILADIAKKSVNMLVAMRGSQTVKTVNLAEEMKNAESILDTFKLVVGAIACISLLVGGIGIMNIMLVTVRERTVEIGIRKAIGADNRSILCQFLTEAVMYSLLGSFGGIILGIGVTWLACAILAMEMSISVEATVLGVVISFAIGVIFGLAPAVKASRMDTVEALRKD